MPQSAVSQEQVWQLGPQILVSSQTLLRQLCVWSHQLLGSQAEIKKFKYNEHLYNCNFKADSPIKGLSEKVRFTLLVTFMPRTTSERRISGVVSPRVLTTDPGKGGKLEAARSNFGGGGTLASIKGIGRCRRKKKKSVKVRTRKDFVHYLKIATEH